MVARLRGRPSPRPSGPPEEEEASSAKSAKPASGNQRALVIVTVISLFAAAGTTGTLIYMSQGGRLGAQEAPLQPQKTGPLLDLGPFIVNLGNINERRYLRIGLSLDFQTRDPHFVKGNETAQSAWISELKNKLKHKEAMFKDVVVTSLSSKRAEDLGSTTGKEALKADLISRMNQFMDPDQDGAQVREVYFTDFVIQ